MRETAITDQQPTDDWIAASLEAMDRYEASLEPAASDPSPQPGDLYVLPATRDYAVEWLVVARESTRGPMPANEFEPSIRVLVMPAESHVLAGSADVEVTSADDSPLVVHCAYGVWIDAALLTPDLRVSRIEPTNLTRVRRRWLELGDGRESDDPEALEVDESTEYQEWIEEVIAPAHRALSKVPASSTPPTPIPVPVVPTVTESESDSESDESAGETPSKQSSSHTPFFKIAASILVALASIQLWRLNDRLQDLEVAYRGAEDRYGAKVSELEGERDQLVGERDRLRTRQEELEAAGEAYREEAGKLRDQVEELDRRLGESEVGEIINLALVNFFSPEDQSRGMFEIELRQDQEHAILIVTLSNASLTRYRLQLQKKGSTEIVWQNDELVPGTFDELRVVVSTDILKRGKYLLEVSELQADGFEKVAEYEFQISKGN